MTLSLRSILFRRRTAYRAVFAGTGELSPHAAVVLADLRKACYVDRTTAHADAHATAVAEGRRQVWLHIQHRLNLSEEQILAATQSIDE